MSQLPISEPVATSPERAAIGLRLYAVVVAFGSIGFGLAGLFVAPEGWCRYLAYGLATIMIPGGGLFLFLGLRGRKCDLEVLTGEEVAEAATNSAATTIGERVVDEVIDKLT